jgi:hypothetical protein
MHSGRINTETSNTRHLCDMLKPLAPVMSIFTIKIKHTPTGHIARRMTRHKKGPA